MSKIPFGWMPGHWGLKGKIREMARIEYTVSDPYEKELALLELELLPEDTKKLMKLDIMLKYNKINQYSYKSDVIDITEKDPVKNTIKHAELNLAEKQITQFEFEKIVANAKKEPWVNVLGLDLESGNPNTGQLELDWNDEFIAYLKEHGYTHGTEEEIVDLWLSTLCKNIAMAEFSGLGDFDERVESAPDIRPPLMPNRRERH